MNELGTVRHLSGRICSAVYRRERFPLFNAATTGALAGYSSPFFFSFSHHSKPWPSMMVIREQIPEWRKLPRWKELRRKKLLDLGGGGLQTTKQWHIESGFSSITFPRSWKLGCGDVWGFRWSGVKLFASSFFKFCLFMLDDSYTLGSRSKNSFGLNREDYWSFESLCLSRGKRRAEFATN